MRPGRALVVLAVAFVLAAAAAHAFRAPPKPPAKRLKRASQRQAMPPGLIARDLRHLLRSVATEVYFRPRPDSLAVSRGQDEDDEEPWAER